MRPLPIAIIAVVVVAFLAVGAYLILGRGGGSGEPLTIDVTVSGTTMDPEKVTVREGDRVTMNVKIDKKEEVHLHGYDITFEAENAGDTVSKTFTADKTGSFQIEIEGEGAEIGSLEVQPR